MRAKKSAHKNFILSWELYPFDVMVSVGETTDQVLKRIRRTSYKLTDEEVEQLNMGPTHKGRTVMLRGGQTILRLTRFNGDPDSVATLAHEAFHAVEFLFARIATTHRDEGEEPWAYALEWLMRNALIRLAR